MLDVLSITSQAIMHQSNIWMWNDTTKGCLLALGVFLLFIGFVDVDMMNDGLRDILITIGTILSIANFVLLAIPWGSNVNSSSNFSRPYYVQGNVSKTYAPKTIALRDQRDTVILKQDKQLINADKHNINNNSQKAYYTKHLHTNINRANNMVSHVIKYNVYLHNVPKHDLQSPYWWTWI